MLFACVAGSEPELATIEVGKLEVVVVDKFEYLRELPVGTMPRPFEDQRYATAQVIIISDLDESTEQSSEEHLVLSD